jgi:hypothetical protein
MKCFSGLFLIGFAISMASGTTNAQVQRKVVVFWQPGFPTISSEPVQRNILEKTFGPDAKFANVAALNASGTLADADLLVLPYGSAVPMDAWKAMAAYIKLGGNLLLVGGQPLHVPVSFKEGKFVEGRPQDSYALALGLKHTYEVPVDGASSFAWREGYAPDAMKGSADLRAKHYYAVEGRLDGLAYMLAADGQKVAAPVIFGAHFEGRWGGPANAGASKPGRFVALDFDPAPGFWETTAGEAMLRRAAQYALQGPTSMSIEAEYATLRPGERPELSLHLRRGTHAVGGEVTVELRAEAKVLETVKLNVPPARGDSIPLKLQSDLPTGFYELVATWKDSGQTIEVYRNGFWVSVAEALQTGPTLGANADTLTRDGKPFLPVGTNYFTTEENGWDFSGARNASVWERDFADMQAHGVSLVRTGVWMSNAKFTDPQTGAVNERFLRNLEGFLLSAQRHGIAVNFTFFAFEPKSGPQPAGPAKGPDADATPTAPLPNPYLDANALRLEEDYVRSIVQRFGKTPFLSWDLINEPSLSNPRHVFSGNYPNGDPVELAAWHAWLQKHYLNMADLADAWSVTPEQLENFENVPLPDIADLRYARNGSTKQVRALDYNLFSQDVFHGWVKAMIATIRDAGSAQIIDVGQDEGGVTDRVLNQFYAQTGVGFTTNHTYWQDDALLWDSVAAKVVGTPNITGETGYQPSWAPDGAWLYDEFTGLGLTERKWALGFAAGSTGAMQWDWAREPDFGMQRSDGSAKVWENLMRDLGAFAATAAPYAHDLQLPPIAIVLPESAQLSVLNNYALEAQQNAVRTLYQEAHGAAYAVGEYQIERLGNPRLILLPSPLGLTDAAWSAIAEHVRMGATLLVTGPFDADAHLHATDRAKRIGLDYRTTLLDLREEAVHWPGGDGNFTFGGKKTTVLPQALLGDGAHWKEIELGKGRILFSPLPLELGQDQEALGRVYRYAMEKSGVSPLAVWGARVPGILICPTEFKDATLYVVTSETEDAVVAFEDPRSHSQLSTTAKAGRAALVMVSTNGHILSSYHWGVNK